MGLQSQELETLFRKLSERYRLSPSSKILRRLRFRLWKSEFFSFSLRKVNFIYSIVFVGGVATGVFCLQKSDKGNISPVDESVVVMEANNIVTKEEIFAETEKAIVPNEDNREVASEIMLMAMFEVETIRGCAPLHVEFSDKSVMADSWQWDFGTGDRSGKQHPEYTYRNPGRYKVALRVKDKMGHEDVYYQEIVVLRRPVASLDIDEDNSEIAERKIVFKNTSEGASKYLWDFGDHKQSEAQQASHVYDDFGIYNVKLIAKSSNGCFDTAMLVNKFIDQNYELSFPQSFKPSPFERSNNGFYENAGNEAFIFYPINMGAREYNLAIYTSNGNKIFETTNIKQGWNGYFGGSLAPGGYYTYIAKGVYPNGKRFELKGKVKVIIEDYYYKF